MTVVVNIDHTNNDIDIYHITPVLMTLDDIGIHRFREITHTHNPPRPSHCGEFPPEANRAQGWPATAHVTKLTVGCRAPEQRPLGNGCDEGSNGGRKRCSA